MNPVLADPAKMITKGAPHVIHNDKELEVYTNALFQSNSKALGNVI
jgi:HTH-type transcriptional regulator/antitoxin HigA